MKNPKVSVLNHDQLLELIYNRKTGECSDLSVFKRIRYFSPNDFDYTQKTQVKPFYTVLQIGGKIVGIAKAGYYSLSAKDERNWSISFFSIDKDYRGKGYSRLMVNALFEYAKQNDFDISPSAYSILGKERVYHLLIEYAAIHGVKFYDEVRMHDAEWMYVVVDGKKLHQSEV